jgi:hypothetical protein
MYFPAGSTRSSDRRFLKPRHNVMATLINAALILLAVTRESTSHLLPPTQSA